ncbi:tetratricopeptide repeat protein [Sphingomicrobium flavum]|uniref:tetratricopeptide repeat protein n=1 Tax=Sphingomicrobium flavum TaxID=1229164 RepID=UPI0021AE0CF4|nr:tetratricopeptide repeat protein [Sphingomicrobium flavum]
MGFFILIGIIQVFCIVDVVKQGTKQFWIFPLLIAPGISAAAYFIVEILPRLKHDRRAQAAGGAIRKAIDPERDVRDAQAQLDMADTVANRARLADALFDAGRHGEAIPLYREVIARSPSAAKSGERFARCLYLADRNEEALEALDAIDLPNVTAERDRVNMLRARILADCDRQEEARALYADLVTRMPGDEVRCRYAGLLLDMGRDKEAELQLTEVEQRLRHGGKQMRKQDPGMYGWAMDKLAELRA